MYDQRKPPLMTSAVHCRFLKPGPHLSQVSFFKEVFVSFLLKGCFMKTTPVYACKHHTAGFPPLWACTSGSHSGGLKLSLYYMDDHWKLAGCGFPWQNHLFTLADIFCKGKTIWNQSWIRKCKKITRQTFLNTQKKDTYPCLSCQNCSSIIKGPYIMHPTKGNSISIKGLCTCDTQNVIYSLKCPCGKTYIGQTTRPIKIRLNEHRSQIRRYKSEKEMGKEQKEEPKWKETGRSRSDLDLLKDSMKNAIGMPATRLHFTKKSLITHIICNNKYTTSI